MAALLLLAGCSRQESPRPAEGAGKGEEAVLTPQSLAEKADVPIYPGAKVPDGRSRAPYEIPNGETRVEIVMETPDPLAKVIAFYEAKVKQIGNASGPLVAGKTPKGNDVLINVSRDGKLTTIKVNAIAYGE